MFEVYWNSDHSELMVESKTGSTFLKDMPKDFFYNVDRAIEDQYPETHNQLADMHGALKINAIKRVTQFLACNFSFKDTQVDIDEDWNFIPENVPCPARLTGVCTLNLCRPQLNTDFSDREKQVLALFVTGSDETEIGERLFISKHTVHNHINNMYQKAGLVGKPHSDRRLVNLALNKILK